MNTSFVTVILYLAFIVVFFYFMAIRPQKKEQKRHQEMLDAMSVGDYCVTTSGFYGQIIDITNDMVIIEFGNKNCRIPVLKSAIARIGKEVSKADAAEMDNPEIPDEK